MNTDRGERDMTTRTTRIETLLAQDAAETVEHMAENEDSLYVDAIVAYYIQWRNSDRQEAE